MKFTFGIITNGYNKNFLLQIIENIEKQVPENCYEIIIVGNLKISAKNTKTISFNENIKKNWITKKKNIITELAKFQNIVYLHDYIKLENGWYEGWLSFGEDWDVAINKIKNFDNKRFVDWIGLPDDKIYGNVLFPYSYSGSSGMYLPGNYFISKKNVAVENPFNEDFVWGEGEDIEWSKRVLGGFLPVWLKNREELIKKNEFHNYKYVVNSNASVKFLKLKHMHLNFTKEYDMHSGDESRPLSSNQENYKYLNFR